MLMRKSLPEREIPHITKLFPTIKKKDFRKLPNGNYCLQVSFNTTGKYACGFFDVLIEYPYNYPIAGPKAWIQRPDISRKTPHVYEWDKENHANICYNRPKKDWHFSYSSYEACLMIESWITTYCRWIKTQIWDWPEAGMLDHLF